MARARRSFPGCTGGFSLVEIMVALTLSLLLLGAVFQIFVSAKASYRMNEGLARLQETGRFAANILTSDIRMAGYQGCMTRNQVEPNVAIKKPLPKDLELYDQSAENVLRGENNLNSENTLGAVAGSDSLSIQKASSSRAHLTGNMQTNNGQLFIDSNPAGFKKDDILMITDCADADIFRVINSTKDSGTVNITHAEKLSKIYGPDATVMAFESITYYVADSGRNNEAGDPIYSLYAQQLDDTVELVAGIENMQVLYGEDTDGDGSADGYVNASAVADFTNVISVRVALLVSSVAPATTQADSTTYKLLDDASPDEDNPANAKNEDRCPRCLRKVFTFTATARNRELRSTMFN